MSKIWRLGLIIIVLLALSLVFLSWSGLIRWPKAPNLAVTRFPHLQSLLLNRQGNRFLQSQNFQSAFDSYVKTLEFDPFSAETHLNLGLTFEGEKQAAKAVPSYQNAQKFAKDDEVKFMAYFNHAQLLGKDKKVDEALELYQKALEIDPTSKETKTNIELLIQMQQKDGKGGDDNQDQKDQKDQKDNKDQKDPKDQKDQKEQDPKDQKDQNKSDKEKEQEKKDKKENPKYAPNQKPQPRKFKGEELSEGDVKKILGEIKQQEQKIRSEYNRKEVKEQPRDKDW